MWREIRGRNSRLAAAVEPTQPRDPRFYRSGLGQYNRDGSGPMRREGTGRGRRFVVCGRTAGVRRAVTVGGRSTVGFGRSGRQGYCDRRASPGRGHHPPPTLARAVDTASGHRATTDRGASIPAGRKHAFPRGGRGSSAFREEGIRVRWPEEHQRVADHVWLNALTAEEVGRRGWMSGGGSIQIGRRTRPASWRFLATNRAGYRVGRASS